MDKHKQFTETVHPIGATIHPVSPLVTPEKFNLKEAELTSDFTNAVDPNAPISPPVIEPPEVVEAPPLEAEPAVASQPSGRVASLRQTIPQMGRWFGNKYVRWGGLGLGIVVIALVGVLTAKTFLFKSPQMVADSSKLDQSTLFIDSKNHTVGVKAATNPSGLQVGATVSATSQGAANIRLGLVNGTDPSIVFEDNQKNSWQVLGAGGSLQFVQGTQARAKLDDKALTLTNALNVGTDTTVTGNTTLGGANTALLTVQGTKVAIPNNLNFADNTFYIETGKGVAVGAASANGNKLYVAGTIRSTSSITADGQVLAAAGSAKSPSFTFSGNTNTGIYRAALNVVGVSAGGAQVLQVQQGSVFTVGGANIEADGYLRAGRGGSSPYFQVARFTGTLDGSGAAVITDGLSTGYARVLFVQGFYRGNSNEALPLNIDFVNSGNFQISGGVAGRQYRATLFYSADNAGW